MCPDYSRRAFLGASASGAALALAPGAAAAQTVAREPDRPNDLVTLNVNGQAYALAIDTRVTLLDALRERIGLTGAKKGCDHGQCGACTVLIDGRRVLSCLTLAAMAEGRAVTTIEGLADPDGDAASDAAGLRRLRRVPVRLLHAGPDHVGNRLRRGGPRRERRGHPRIYERQSLPLRRLSQHCCRHRAGRAPR